jgi:hypothetical protein
LPIATATGYGRLLFPAAFAKGGPTLESLEWTPLREELQKRGLLEIIARRDRMDGIDRSLAELPSFAFGRSGMREVDVRILYGNHLKKSLPREAREQEISSPRK